MKVAYFGFDLFYDCLEQIFNSGNEIVRIFTCKVDGVYEFSDKVYKFAEQHNIPITDEKPTRRDIDLLKDQGCELLFSAGYYHLIPIIDSLEGVNVHPAILPVGRGPWPQPVALLKSLDTTGVTLHKLAAGFDAGDIVMQSCFHIDSSDNLLTLSEKYLSHAVSLVKEFFDDPMFYLHHATQQSNGEYWPEPSKEDMTFSLDDDYEKIDRITRAFYGFFCFLSSDTGFKKIERAFCTRESVTCADAADIIKIKDGWLVILKYA